MHQDENGVVTVERADPVIRVTRGLLAAMLSDHYDPQSGRLRLDTAGEYVYEYLRPDPNESGCDLFGRVR